ncbi:hypothetical protein L209DRAFT_480131 [Thermothelomyces heterothallicus CBS 203.75]
MFRGLGASATAASRTGDAPDCGLRRCGCDDRPPPQRNSSARPKPLAAHLRAVYLLQGQFYHTICGFQVAHRMQLFVRRGGKHDMHGRDGVYFVTPGRITSISRVHKRKRVRGCTASTINNQTLHDAVSSSSLLAHAPAVGSLPQRASRPEMWAKPRWSHSS